jgi:hypothetical protein
MKQLKIFKDSGEYVIERINEFNHSTKRSFITEEGLLDGLQAYQSVISEYDVQVSEELWGTVINFLSSLQ